MFIEEITRYDFEQFWPVFKDTIQAEETYAFDPKMDFEAGYELWCLMPHKTYIAKDNNKIIGSYYIKPNAQGPGSHVCNCGYIVVPEARGKGIARELCLHSQEIAVQLGYRAMQFNSVVSTNETAIHLWKNLGYSTIGCIPKGFKHKQHGYVDCYIMYKFLING